MADVTTKNFGYYLWAAHGLPIGLGIVVYPTEQSLESVAAQWSLIIGDVYATELDHPETLNESSDVVPYDGVPGFWLPSSVRLVLKTEGIEMVRQLGLAQDSR